MSAIDNCHYWAPASGLDHLQRGPQQIRSVAAAIQRRSSAVLPCL